MNTPAINASESQRQWDVSYTSIVLRVETIRIPRAECDGLLLAAQMFLYNE